MNIQALGHPELPLEDDYTNGPLEGLDPELWAMQLGLLVDRVHQSEIRRVLIEGIRRDTLIAHGTPNSTSVNTFYGAMPTPQFRLAQSTGADAVVFLDLSRRPGPTATGLPSNHAVSLVHELAHALNTTWGGYSVAGYSTAEQARYDSNAPEETRAWILENMFRVERGVAARRTYLGDMPLPPGAVPSPRNTGIPLRGRERDAVQHLRTIAPPVASRLTALARDRCPYNPFRHW
ncbi:MAG: hypothetical protein AB8I08_34535 [Sandaracinaceae bacterium]